MLYLRNSVTQASTRDGLVVFVLFSFFFFRYGRDRDRTYILQERSSHFLSFPPGGSNLQVRSRCGRVIVIGRSEVRTSDPNAHHCCVYLLQSGFCVRRRSFLCIPRASYVSCIRVCNTLELQYLPSSRHNVAQTFAPVCVVTAACFC